VQNVDFSALGERISTFCGHTMHNVDMTGPVSLFLDVLHPASARGQAPWPDDVTDVHVATRSGERVLTARERHTDFADTELELTLDDAGRPRLLRVRSARWGVVPAGRWSETAYAYPDPERWRRSAGGAPRPLCR
jgi:hypothetical protein